MSTTHYSAAWWGVVAHASEFPAMARIDGEALEDTLARWGKSVGPDNHIANVKGEEYWLWCGEKSEVEENARETVKLLVEPSSDQKRDFKRWLKAMKINAVPGWRHSVRRY